MKITGFSLIELLMVMLITAILLSLGFNTYTDSKIKSEIRLDQQYLLQLPALVENYFSEQFNYPDSLDDFLTVQNGQFSTPKNYYTIAYTVANGTYLFTATASSDPTNPTLATCHLLLIHSSGLLKAFDNDSNDVSAECWD